MERQSAHLYLSVVTIAEIEDGIARSRRTGAVRKADHLAAWLQTLLHLYAARVLPLTLGIARRHGQMSDFARGQGYTPGWADLAIAATAASHGYVVLTRNIRHFAQIGVPALDPFTSLLP